MKFGELVEKVRDSGIPTVEEAATYIGLEHMDADSFSIRKWGSEVPLEVPKTRIRKGDVLFARRNTHLRRTAIAPFDAFFSPDGYAFRSRSNALSQDFLLLIVASSAFHNFAITRSAGTHSKRVRWEQLADFRFRLPPLEEQGRYVELVGAIRAAAEAWEDVLSSDEALIEATLATAYTSSDSDLQLQHICAEPITYGIVQAGPNVADGIPYIRVSDMTSNEGLSIDGMLRTSPEIAARYKRSTVSAGDIVVALRGDVGLARVVPPVLHGANLTQGTARVAVSDAHNRDYVLWALQSQVVKRQMQSQAKGSTFVELTLASLRALRIPMVPRKDQDIVAGHLNQLSAARRVITAHLHRARRLLRVVLDDLSSKGLADVL